MFDTSVLPSVNAVLNGTSAILLVAGYAAIRRRWIGLHRAMMSTAFATSILFLISYVVYHVTQLHTVFRGEGWVVYFYYGMLISHVVLAVSVVPLAIITLRRALRADFRRHRRLARWTLPIWLYVSVTGVAIYLMLYVIYPAG
ncbi:MAG: DUF420 domain-containing protein [SAR324 cluster bacterium]|nr:DUF420 domain-containing protein [SAR324 cluster bacterium]